MKLKKILAAVAAAAVAVSTMAVNAFASEPVKIPNAGYKPIPILSSSVTVPDSVYGADVEVTFNISVNDMNGGWNNGSAGILSGEDIVTETKYGGTECDAESNRSWFPAGSVVIANDQKTATIVCKADLTGKSDFNFFIFSGDPSGSDNGAFNLESVTIKNAAGFEATYADGKFTVAGGDAAETEAAETEAAPEETEAEAPAPAEEAAEDEDVDVDVEEDEPEEEAEEPAPAVTEAPAAEVAPAVENTPAPATGNTAVATVVAVMAVAGAAAIVAKKRK